MYHFHSRLDNIDGELDLALDYILHYLNLKSKVLASQRDAFYVERKVEPASSYI